MCSAVGLPVRDLRRIRMGPIGLGRLKPGQWRDLTPEEVRRLKTEIVSDDSAASRKIRYDGAIESGRIRSDRRISQFSGAKTHEAHRISGRARTGAACRGLRVGFTTRVRTGQPDAEHQERRVADVHRGPPRLEVLAARSDQRHQLQQDRSRVATEDR